MALQPEIWRNDIVANLYKGNEFANRATIADQYVVGGRAVHIPNAAPGSGVVKNRTTLPATVIKRTDNDVIYLLDEYTSNPILVPHIDTIQLSYDKRANVLAEDMATIKQVQADWLLYNWGSTNTKTIRTTGALAANRFGATGQRRIFRKEDLLAAKIIMDKDNVPSDGRVALLPPDFIGDLLGDTTLTVNFVQYANLAEGIVGRIHGFDIMERASVLTTDNTAGLVVKTPDAASAADDNAMALCWHPFAVERAMGDVKTFAHEDAPTYYGSIFSFLCMMGGRVRRTDNKGIVAIVEATV